MRRLLTATCMGLILVLGTAASVQCPAPPPPPPVATTVLIEYINNTGVDILVDLLASSDPNISEEDLLLTGNLFRDTVPAGGPSVQFELNCNDAQAIIIDRAVELIVDGQAVGSTILYQDLDYFCGDIASFEFALDENGDLAVFFTAVVP